MNLTLQIQISDGKHDEMIVLACAIGETPVFQESAESTMRGAALFVPGTSLPSIQVWLIAPSIF